MTRAAWWLSGGKSSHTLLCAPERRWSLQTQQWLQPGAKPCLNRVHCTTPEPFPSLPALSSHLQSVPAAIGFAKSVRTSPHKFPLCFWHDLDCFLCPPLQNHSTSSSLVSFTLPTMFSEMYMSYPITSPLGEGSWRVQRSIDWDLFLPKLVHLDIDSQPVFLWGGEGARQEESRRNQEQEVLFWKN